MIAVFRIVENDITRNIIQFRGIAFNNPGGTPDGPPLLLGRMTFIASCTSRSLMGCLSQVYKGTSPAGVRRSDQHPVVIVTCQSAV